MLNNNNLLRVDDFEFVSGVMNITIYAAIIAIFIMIIALVLKLLWNWDSDEQLGERSATPNETSRLVLSSEKIMFSFYGSLSSEDDIESGKVSSKSSSSDDLYDEKICAICYDGHRSCLFVPCGHCITCYTCAKRMVNDDIKACPICRTTIHKVRRLQML